MEAGEIGKRFGSSTALDVLSQQYNGYATAVWVPAPSPGYWDGWSTAIARGIWAGRKYGKPVINTEYGYEWLAGYGANFNMQAHGTDKCRRAAWSIFAAAAPRPLLLVCATGDWTRHGPELEGAAIHGVYDSLGIPDRFRVVQFEAPHNYNKDSRQAVYAWFAHWLQHAPAVQLLPEQPLKVEPRENLLVYNASHPRPADALGSAALAASLEKRVRAQLDSLVPHDARSLAVFRQWMKSAIQYTLGVRWIQRDKLRAERRQVAAGQSTLDEPRVHAEGLPGSLLLRASHGVASGHEVTLVVTGGASDGQEMTEALVTNRVLCFLLALKHHPRETPSGGDADQLKEFPETYFRSALAWQVQDVLTALSYLSGPAGFTRVDLAGLGDAGPPVLLARALDSSGRVKTTAVDMDGISEVGHVTWKAAQVQPALLRFGGLDAAAALVAPERLILFNTQGHFHASAASAAYQAAGHNDAFSLAESPWRISEILRSLSSEQ